MNVGTLKKIIADLDDDYTVDVRVRRAMTEDEIKHMCIYPYPWITANTTLEFDDVGVSDRVLCLGCEVDLIDLFAKPETIIKSEEC